MQIEYSVNPTPGERWYFPRGGFNTESSNNKIFEISFPFRCILAVVDIKKNLVDHQERFEIDEDAKSLQIEYFQQPQYN